MENVVDASLMPGGFGWAWNGGRRLLTTADGGETWREVTPPEIDPGFIGATFFLDPDLGWVGVSYPQENEGPQNTAIMSTQDGGQVWQVEELEVQSPYGDPGHIIDVWFLDAQHGWVSLDFTATMNSSTGELLRTADGGRTWERSELPNAGPVSFNSPAIGWTIGNFNNGARKLLYRTLDGGETWQPQTVLAEPVDDGIQYNDYLLPVFFDEREGILAVLVSDAGYELTGVAFYHTDDAGYTWRPVSTLPVLVTSLEWGQAAVDILDSRTWMVASDEGALYRTVDGGRHWQAVERAEGDPRLNFQGLSFASQAVGWSLGFEFCEGGVIGCLELYGTDDGGQHWARLRVGG